MLLLDWTMFFMYQTRNSISYLLINFWKDNYYLLTLDSNRYEVNHRFMECCFFGGRINMDFIHFKVFYPIHLPILLMSVQKHHCNYSTRSLAIHLVLFSGKCYLILSLFIGVQSLCFFCSDCAIGKNHKLSFSYSTSSLFTSLELVYYDVWGPASVSSHSGYKYCVVCWWVHKTQLVISFESQV